MKEIGFEELRDIQLEMLLKVDDFCKKNKIKYYLIAGTLIGAVRHQGFIPWDDDIDIMMLREDYDRFIRCFNGSVEHLVVAAPELDWNYYAPYANVYDDRTLLFERNKSHRGVELGVKIDVFPFDDLPKSEIVYTITRKISNIFNFFLSVKRSEQPFKEMNCKYKFAKIFLNWIPFRWSQKIIHIIGISKWGGISEDVFSRVFDIKKPMRTKKKSFGDGVYVPFEQYQFPIPTNPDDFLRVRYGDYMKLPPEEERVPHHNFTAYWK